MPRFQHAEAPVQGDRFVRKMATYGQVRPSVSFTSESRAQRPFKEGGAVDVSQLPNPFLDPRGDARELSLEYPLPPQPENSHVKMFENHSLMMPSERFQEFLQMKAGAKKWQEDRDASFFYKKRIRTLENHYPNGILGIDGPTFPDTQLYAQRREQLLGYGDLKSRQAEARHDHLSYKNEAQDGAAFRRYGEPLEDMKRSEDVGMQRKCVDAQRHPTRFVDTHERLFKRNTRPWDPGRAAMIRSHDVREKEHNIVTGVANAVTLRVRRWDENMPKTARAVYFNVPEGSEALSQTVVPSLSTTITT